MGHLTSPLRLAPWLQPGQMRPACAVCMPEQASSPTGRPSAAPTWHVYGEEAVSHHPVAQEVEEVHGL